MSKEWNRGKPNLWGFRDRDFAIVFSLHCAFLMWYDARKDATGETKEKDPSINFIQKGRTNAQSETLRKFYGRFILRKKETLPQHIAITHITRTHTITHTHTHIYSLAPVHPIKILPLLHRYEGTNDICTKYTKITLKFKWFTNNENKKQNLHTSTISNGYGFCWTLQHSVLTQRPLWSKGKRERTKANSRPKHTNERRTHR